MKYAYDDLVFADTELEQERMEFLETLDHYHAWLKKQAETVLGCKVISVVPSGAITNPDRFNEECDIIVNFALGTTGQLAIDLSEQLQYHFENLPIENIGVIKPMVYV